MLVRLVTRNARSCVALRSSMTRCDSLPAVRCAQAPWTRRMSTSDTKDDAPKDDGFWWNLREKVFGKKKSADSAPSDNVTVVEKRPNNKLLEEVKDLTKLGKKGLASVSESDQKQLTNNLNMGVFTLDDFLIQIRMSRHSAQTPEEIADADSELAILEAMTVAERRSNAAMVKRQKGRVRLRVARKLGVDPSVVVALLRKYEMVRITHQKCLEWDRAGQEVPNDFGAVCRKADAEGAFDELRRTRI